MRERITHVAMVAMVLTAVLGAVAPARAGENVPFTGASCAEPSVAMARPVAYTAPKTAARATATARPAAQVTRNETADITFELRAAEKGGLEVTGTTGDLRIKKTVQGNGDFVLELTTPRDTVSLVVNGQETSATRGRSRVRMPRSNAGATDEGQTRRLLADSDAVLKLRAAAATLIDANDRTPSSMSILMADAVVGMLTGDVGAPRRVARFLGSRGGSGTRPAAMALDCFTLMETRMNEAMNDYISCWVAVAPWIQNWCAYRWVLQVESYWFSFISCSGFNNF